MPGSAFKRSKIYVHPIQKRYVAATVGILIVYTMVIALILFLPPAVTLLTSSSPEAVREAASEFAVLDARLWPILLVILFVGIVVLLLTHRTAGPLFRVERVIDALGSGDLRVRFQFRNGDHLKGMETPFNRSIYRIENAFVELDARLADMERAVSGHPPDVDTAKRLAAEMRGLVGEFSFGRREEP